MNKFVYSKVNKLCSTLLTLAFMNHFHGVCFLFFGEPKYPSPEDYMCK